MVKRYKGGLISATEATTSTTIASGMWSATTAIQARKAGAWPSLLASEPPASVGGGGGGTGPTISNVSVTNSSYTVLDDTPYISTSGGYIKITGTGFVSGCTVYYGGSAATSTTFVSSTEVRAQIGASSSNTYMVYVVNPDSSTGILLNAITFSGTPSWVTSAALSDQLMDVAFSVQLSATSDSSVTYALTAGSSTPSGTTLYSNGVFSGTVTGLSVDTNYSFSVDAVDTENQDTARTFTVNIVSGDTYFNTTTLLLNGDIGNVWITDSSTNKFLPTISGDTRPTAFSPYNTNWSLYFPGANNYLTVGSNAGYNPGNTGAWTFECFVYPTNSTGGYFYGHGNGSAYGNALAIRYASSQFTFDQGDSSASNPVVITSAASYPPNQWYHFSVCKDSSNVIRMFVNGVQVGTQTYSGTVAGSGQPFINGINDNVGFGRGGGVFYLSDVHWVVGTALYTSTPFTPPSGRISAVANTKILIGQNNRFLDTGTLAGNWTRGGSPQISSFGRFTESDSTTGSAYFDGTGDYLTYTNNAAYQFGTGDFTVECWVYFTTTLSSTSYYPLSCWSGNSGWELYYRGVATAFSWYYNASALVGTKVPTAFQWYHIAVTRSSGTTRLFVNGNIDATLNSDTTNFAPSSTLYVGIESGTTGAFPGYIADVRVIKGTAQYSANFTPATSSLSFVANTQVLTLQYRVGENNHRFIDESGVRALTTRTSNAHNGSFSPFSPAGWSHYFDGSSAYYDFTASTTFNEFLTGDFTVECWIYYTGTDSFSGNPTVLAVYTTWSTAVSYEIEVQSGGVVRFAAGNSVPIDLKSSGAGLIAANGWYHVAAARASGVTRLFVNGANVAAHSGSVSISQAASGMRIGAAFGGGGNKWTGYVSDLRIVKGQAAYTANFTPATSSLSTTSQSVTSANVFLGCNTNRFIDANTTPKTISSITGSPKVQAFSPFRPSGQYTPATHGGSAYFDGSGDYVYITNSPAMTLGTNDHCIEFWMYPNGSQNQYTTVWWYSLGASSGATNTYYFSIGSDAGGSVTLLGGPLSGTWAVTISLGSTEYTAVLNNWTHVVITRRGSAYRLFLNGILKGYTTYAGSIIAQGGSFSIGWDGANATTYYKGWLSNFRVINGSIPTAYQTSSTTTSTIIFTPPTSVPAFDANTVMAMNFTHSGIIDITGRQDFETVGNVTISNVQSRFGTGSLYFDGTGDYLKAPISPNYQFGTGDVTIECWIYLNSYNASSSQIAGSYYAAVATDWLVAINSTGKITCQFGATSHTSTSSVSLTTWTHIAVVRGSGTVTMYINGTNAGGGGSNTSAVPANSYGCTIGADSSGSTLLNGYIDELRITRYARTITLPTSAFLTK